jgi:hypothetical protein
VTPVITKSRELVTPVKVAAGVLCIVGVLCRVLYAVSRAVSGGCLVLCRVLYPVLYLVLCVRVLRLGTAPETALTCFEALRRERGRWEACRR